MIIFRCFKTADIQNHNKNIAIKIRAKNHLREQLGFLSRSAFYYDEGACSEAKRVGTNDAFTPTPSFELAGFAKSLAN
uniref:hypothetical protein n=1 Tax=Cellvibrio fontiphilus TaxID=1815559 RepID=UPI002B4BBCE9|nr:hypothetical protein [Cellvibrio fontiphilus]